MKDKFINEVHLEGYLYEHKLEKKVTGDTSKNPGTEYIRGSLDIATDDKLLNIVTVNYTYVTEKTSKGNTNATFTVLNNIVNGVYKTVMKDGASNATKLRIDTSIDLNEFYSDKDGKETLVSVKRNDGGFIHVADAINDDEKKRNTFKVDIVINNVTRKEADTERNIPEKVIVKGAIFNSFRKNLLPTEFTAVNEAAMSYFENLGVTKQEPVFTCIWGRQISETVVREIRTESAFGEDEVREVKNTRKEFIITGAAPQPYVWDDPGSITAAELNEAVQKREIDLAAMKKRNEEYKASKASPAARPAIANSEFNF